MKDKNIIDYRLHHERCRFCKYYHYINPCYYCLTCIGDDIKMCTLKDKPIKLDIMAKFCSYYVPKE